MAAICHNTPGLPVNRRHLIATAPALGLAGLFAASAAPAAAETPVMAMYREIIRLRDILNDDHGLTEAEANAMCDQMMDLANDIVDVPSRDALDLIHKIMGYTVDGAHEVGDGPHPDAIWAEARALIGGAA